MKRLFTFLFVLTLVLGFSLQTQAELFNRGTDTRGNRLIYDSDLNITWYDYSNSGNTWQNQLTWAGALDVNFGGFHFTDWRLPSTVDGPYVWGYNGNTTAGYNITTSEMGHLFYTELGNKGWDDKSGNRTGCSVSSPWCLTNTGDFQNLLPDGYWSGTEAAVQNKNGAWYFGFNVGGQGGNGKGGNGKALAVRPGDITVVPEPISYSLFITGGVFLVWRKLLKKA